MMNVLIFLAITSFVFGFMFLVIGIGKAVVIARQGDRFFSVMHIIVGILFLMMFVSMGLFILSIRIVN